MTGRDEGDAGAAVVEDAVTVILVKDAPDVAPGGDRLEVLLLERHGASAFAPGALVFPGGKLDPADAQLDPARVRCADPEGWADRLGVAGADAAVAMLVAAVRETFEEAGVLLARRHGAEHAVPALPGDLELTRAQMAARDGAFDWREWLAREELVLDLDAMAMWSWWVTPQGLPRRYDTRFLVAGMPAGQAATHDAVETTSMRWIPPADALAAHAEGRLHVIFPTRRTLEQLATHRDAASVLAAARSGAVDLRRIEPSVVRVDGAPMVQHPDGGPPAQV
ncbi:MAG: NUDIX hydrolase [Nitriliruptor sp.]|nr:MAG: NUDIX hydrolase [Nitriliruptor sp.]